MHLHEGGCPFSACRHRRVSQAEAGKLDKQASKGKGKEKGKGKGKGKGKKGRGGEDAAPAVCAGLRAHSSPSLPTEERVLQVKQFKRIT